MMRRFLAASLLLALVGGCDRADKGRGAMVAEMLAARQARRAIAPLHLTYGEMSIPDAYGVQEELARRLVAAGHKVAGYKVGYASKASQEAWGIAAPTYGRLFDFQKLEDGATIPASEFHFFHIEVEVAFVMGRRVDKTVNRIEELKPCVKSVHAGYDIPDNRFDPAKGKANITDIIADGVGAHRWMLGPPVNPADVDVDKVVGTVEWEGQVVYKGAATNVLGSPWNSLLWLANHLVSRGYALEPGDVVLTGALDKAFTGKDGKVAGACVGDCGPAGKVTATVK